MGLPSFATVTLTVVRPPLINDHGTLVADWSDVDNLDEVPVPGCHYQPAPSGTNANRRDASLVAWLAFLPAEVDVLATDGIRLPDGTLCEIDGEPARWTSPSGYLDHVELNLRRWEG